MKKKRIKDIDSQDHLRLLISISSPPSTLKSRSPIPVHKKKGTHSTHKKNSRRPDRPGWRTNPQSMTARR